MNNAAAQEYGNGNILVGDDTIYRLESANHGPNHVQSCNKKLRSPKISNSNTLSTQHYIKCLMLCFLTDDNVKYVYEKNALGGQNKKHQTKLR